MPEFAAVSHIDLSVSDVEKSAAWYCDVLGLKRLRRSDLDNRIMIVLRHEDTGLIIGLNQHQVQGADRFDEHSPGLDHIGFSVPERADLDVWEPRPPLSGPGKFGQLEGLQYVELGGVPHIVFSCDEDELHPDLNIEGQPGGVWVLPGETLLGPWNLNSARRVDHGSLYAASVVSDVDGTQRLLGFRDVADGEFVGAILDPVDMELES